ncbi:GNAT family N-acetyltransferase [Hymenobacter sp. BT730]|uniref:GNAT family N-acetyltransferase n=1 Tax=Hymenobacter sp. BT730 TaxID=3063332 RepID=UPI0026DEF75F|nr:GNAT family N-acetyltransferase [Hymenobacter sp. BT730]
MSTNILPLPWDSSFLGFPVGRLQGSHLSTTELRDTLQAAHDDGWALLYWMADPSDTASMEAAHNNRLSVTDRRGHYELTFPEGSPQPLPLGVSSTVQLSPALMELALQSGHQSRFRMDPHFAKGVYERLYAHWIANSLSGEMAHDVLVFRTTPESPETGMLTLCRRPEHVEIGLIAVDANAQNQGIGSLLVAGAQQRALAWGRTKLVAVTQLDNDGACRFYERQGFQLAREEHLYHLWLQEIQNS